MKTTNLSYTSILTDGEKDLFALINYVCLCEVISAFGILANIINLVIFYKQGLNTTINISFFSLAISDLSSLVLQQLFNLFVNPLFVQLNLPIVYTEVQFLVTALKREMFAKVTCLITVYITFERCFCITFPLHVKQVITPRRTAVIIACIYIITAASIAPLYGVLYLDWSFFPDKNRSLLAIAFREGKGTTEQVVYSNHGMSVVISFLAVVMFTLILIHKLRQKITWRKTANVNRNTSAVLSTKERATISMVVLIASILVICYTPAVMLCFTTMFVPEFSMTGRYNTLYYSLWTVALLTENINSSVNIFLYFKMSTKFRQTFRELFARCLPSTVQKH